MKGSFIRSLARAVHIQTAHRLRAYVIATSLMLLLAASWPMGLMAEPAAPAANCQPGAAGSGQKCQPEKSEKKPSSASRFFHSVTGVFHSSKNKDKGTKDAKTEGTADPASAHTEAQPQERSADHAASSGTHKEFPSRAAPAASRTESQTHSERSSGAASRGSPAGSRGEVPSRGERSTEGSFGGQHGTERSFSGSRGPASAAGFSRGEHSGERGGSYGSQGPSRAGRGGERTQSASRADAQPRGDPRTASSTRTQGLSGERSLKDSGSSRKNAAPRSDHQLDMGRVAQLFSVSREQLESGKVKVITAGGSFSVSQLDPNVAEQNLTLARRTAQSALVVSVKPAEFWGGTPLLIPVPASAESESSQAGTFAASVASAAAPAAAPAPVATYSLPISFSGVSSSSKPVSFQAVVMVLNGLHYQESNHRFVSRIAVGLRDTEKPEDRSTLGNPVKLEIQASAADSVTPGEVQISKLGDPQTVEISAAAPTAPFKVQARTLLDQGDAIEIPIEKTPIYVRPAQTAINGWGLAKTLLEIEVPGLTEGGHSVVLSTDRGQIVPAVVALDSQGRGKAVLRSDGTGTAQLTAAGANFLNGTAAVSFSFPKNFLLATLLGAFAGWLAKKRARALTGPSCVVGVASGCILGTGYAIGVHWLPWAPDAGVGEGLSFFVAAAGAYGGMKMLMKYEPEEGGGLLGRLGLAGEKRPNNDTLIRDATGGRDDAALDFLVGSSKRVIRMRERK